MVVFNGPGRVDNHGGQAPETPLDEPRPPRVDDPPPQPDPKGPYVVTGPGQHTEGG